MEGDIQAKINPRDSEKEEEEENSRRRKRKHRSFSVNMRRTVKEKGEKIKSVR